MIAPSILTAAAFAFVAVIATVVGAGNANAVADDRPPAGVMISTKNKRVRLAFSQQDARHSLFSIIRLAVTEKNDIVVPLLQVSQPRFVGPNGELQDALEWQQFETAVVKDRPVLYLPVDESISRYLFIVTFLDRPGEPSKAPWRVWEVTRKDVWTGTQPELVVPDFSKAPRFNERKDQAEVISLIDRAADYLIKLRNQP